MKIWEKIKLLEEGGKLKIGAYSIVMENNAIVAGKYTENYEIYTYKWAIDLDVLKYCNSHKNTLTFQEALIAMQEGKMCECDSIKYTIRDNCLHWFNQGNDWSACGLNTSLINGEWYIV